MSSADTGIYTATSHATFLTRRKNPVAFLRWAVIGIVLAEIVIAYFFRDIVGAAIISVAVQVVFSVAMIYIIAGGKNHQRFIASAIGAALALIPGFWIFGLDPAVIVSPIIGGTVGLLWGIWKKASTNKIVQESVQ